MCGCIAMFEAIDPEAQMIETFAGGKRDTAYLRSPDKGWAAISFINGNPEGPASDSEYVKPGESANLVRAWRRVIA